MYGALCLKLFLSLILGSGMGFKEWWEQQPQWFKWIISGIVAITLGAIGTIVPSLLTMLYEAVGTQGFIIILTTTIPLLAALLLSQKYILDILGRKLDTITSILIKIAERLGVEVGKSVQSPGYVYTMCRWLRISREYVDNAGTHHIYVYCGHPQNPMTPHGCPPGCPYLDTSDTPTGTGAFAGLVFGGLLGLILGGAPGVFVGGLLGAIIGNSLEVAKPVQRRIAELQSRGINYAIHVDGQRLKTR